MPSSFPAVDVPLSLHPPRIQDPIEVPPFREWIFPDGVVWTQFHRFPSAYLLRFPAWADFEITDDVSVNCWPCPGVTRASVDHIFLNQVLPLARSRQGRMMFHASAVEVDEAAVVFMAPTGRGKSTLAASFATSGHRFLTDDGLLLETRAACVWASPSQPSLRLWKDSEDALISQGALRAPQIQYSSKSRILAGDTICFCPEPRPLRRAYFLGEREVAQPQFEAMSPSRVVEELVRNSFLLDVDEKGSLAAHFHELVALANRPLFFRLDYPRSFSELPEVRRAIIGHATPP